MRPVRYAPGSERSDCLELGLHGEHIDFEWRPYAQRSPEARADYDKLVVSLFHDGQLKPVIVWTDRAEGIWRTHVLTGMRRVAILRRFGGDALVDIVCIQEDVRLWTLADLPRLEALKAEIGSVDY